MRKIEMVDLAAQYHRLRDEIDAAVARVLNDSVFIKGPEVRRFEEALASVVGTRHVIGCGNGTDALQIALMALDLKPGAEVIVPAFTYVAVAEVAAFLGLRPVFADVHEETFNIDVAQVESKITGKTKAIMPVHLFGQCAEMESLLALAQKHHLHVVEDAAQALGTQYHLTHGHQAHAGTMGVIGCTSFFPSKSIGALGDGGALYTDDDGLAERIRMIGSHGQREKYQHEIIGVNSRLDALQAAVLHAKLHHLEDFTRRRQDVADYYDNRLKQIHQLHRPVRSRWSTHNFHQYTIRVGDGKRDLLKQALAVRNIPSMVYYPFPLHLQKAFYRHDTPLGSFPVAERLCGSVLSLPIHTEMDMEQLDYICDAIKEFFES